jgi:hypothetical protein
LQLHALAMKVVSPYSFAKMLKLLHSSLSGYIVRLKCVLFISFYKPTHYTLFEVDVVSILRLLNHRFLCHPGEQ